MVSTSFVELVPMHPRPPVTSAHAICVYAEPLVAGRRVAVIADASLGLGERLTGLGARVVHVYDTSAERVRAAAKVAVRGVVVAELPTAEFDVRDGAFDAALVPDLALVPNPPALLSRLRRLVGPAGAVLVGARNVGQGLSRETSASSVPTANRGPSDGVDYYELYDLLSMQFEVVRMVGQIPFVGVTMAELGGAESSPQVSVDTQLVLEPQEPDFYLALGSQKGHRLDPYAIVQLPKVPATPGMTTTQGAGAGLGNPRGVSGGVVQANVSSSAFRSAPAQGPATGTSSGWGTGADAASELRALEKERAQQEERHAAELARLQARLDERLTAFADVEARAALLERELAEVREANRRGDGRTEPQRVQDLEGRIAQRDERIRRLEASSSETQVRAERIASENRRIQEELDRHRERQGRLARELEEEKQSRRHLEAEIGALRSSPELGFARDHVQALEVALRQAEQGLKEWQQRAMEAQATRHGADDGQRQADQKLADALAAKEREMANFRIMAEEEQAFLRQTHAEAQEQWEAEIGKLHEANHALAAHLDQHRASEASWAAELQAAQEIFARWEAERGLAMEREAQLEDALEQAERQLAQSEDAVEELAVAHADEIDAFEARLQERSQAVRSLEENVRRLERVGQELLSFWAERTEEEAAEAHGAELASGAQAVDGPETTQGVEAPVGDTENGMHQEGVDDLPRALAESWQSQQAAADADRLRRELDDVKRALAESQEGVTAGLSWKEQLEAVSLECARWEAELQTSAWRIAELEQRTAMLKAILDSKGNATSMEASRTPPDGSASDGIAPEDTSRTLARAPAPDPGPVPGPVPGLVSAPAEEASEGEVPSDSWG